MAEVINIKPVQNFFCIGVQKAGTTTLADILSQHSNIYLPEVKETKFFLLDALYQKGLDYYNNTFYKNYTGEKAVGEFDPDYMLGENVAERIFQNFGPQVKFIVIFRHPVDRAYSHYLMTRRKGLESFSFEEALQNEVGRKSNMKEQKVFAYKQRSLYAVQLGNYFRYFPKENFLFLVFEEDIVKNIESTVQRVQQFLDLPFEQLETNLHSNQAFEAKNEMVRDLVRKPNFAKKIFKLIMPSVQFRKKIRGFLIRKNAQAASAPKLEAEVRKRLFDEMFRDDIANTELLINRKLNYS